MEMFNLIPTFSDEEALGDCGGGCQGCMGGCWGCQGGAQSIQN